MKLFIILFFIPFIIFATEAEDSKEEKPKEKRIDVINPVNVKKLDKEVKSDDDIEESIEKGVGEDGGSKIIDPHNFKDVKDNKIKTQKISEKDQDEIDPTKFMTGLGDKDKDGKNVNEKDDKKGKLINPNSTGDPFNDKKIVQGISNKTLFDIIDISGDIGVRFSLDGDVLSLQSKANLSFGKSFKNSSFKITIGTREDTSISNDWKTISTIENNKVGVGLKEIYINQKFIDNLLVLKLGRFFSVLDNDYFFSKSLSFDGLNLYGKFKNGIYYNALFSLVKNENEIMDSTDIPILSVFDLGYKNKSFNIDLYYVLLYGKNLNNFFEDYITNKNNQYLSGNTSYTLGLGTDKFLVFSLDGSYNFTEDSDKLGASFSITHKTKKLESKWIAFYKEKNSVIFPLTLQEDFLLTDVMGSGVNFKYKTNDSISYGIEFFVFTLISESNHEINQLTRLFCSVNF